MPRKLSDIERDAMELTPRERAILVERLLATLDPGDDTDTEELWLQEAEKRYAEYRAGKIASRSADQVIKEARQRLQ
jgi:putative addiction module component (TIGR02574 family)